MKIGNVFLVYSVQQVFKTVTKGTLFRYIETPTENTKLTEQPRFRRPHAFRFEFNRKRSQNRALGGSCHLRDIFIAFS